MSSTRRLITPLMLAVILAVIASASNADEAPQKKQPPGKGFPGVYKAVVTPNWFANNTRFWYRNDLRDGVKEFILVDAEDGKRGPAFDHEKLAIGLSKAAGKEYKADRLPFNSIEFVDHAKAIRFT